MANDFVQFSELAGPAADAVQKCKIAEHIDILDVKHHRDDIELRAPHDLKTNFIRSCRLVV